MSFQILHDLEKIFFEENFEFHSFQNESLLMLSQPDLNTALLDTLLLLMDKKVEVDIERFKNFSIWLKERAVCFQNEQGVHS
jgi:hypothetical protein